MLLEPVNGAIGTAKYCKINGIDVAAKTGTTNFTDNAIKQLNNSTEYNSDMMSLELALFVANGEVTRVEFNLSNQNQESYNIFRDYYNKTKNPLDLFILSCFSFNNQMRFNNDFEFNMPFGLRSYNDQIESNLRRFCDVLHSGKFVFSSKDFRDFDYSVLNRDDVVYCDPP